MSTRENSFKLISMLSDHGGALHRSVIMRKLGIMSEPTFYRAVKTARAMGNGNIVCKNAYYCLENADQNDNAIMSVIPCDDELIALLTIQKIVRNMTSGLLDDALRPLSKKCDAILKLKIKKPELWAEKIKVLDIHYRRISEGIFGAIVNALARQYAIRFDYTDSSGFQKPRTVSPQHLVRYRDNWYLDAWCHDRKDLRIFSLDTISNIRHINKKYCECPGKICTEILATSYGIFSGKPNAVAKIRLSGKAARYAQREQWHPLQKLTCCNDETVLLEIPYSKPHELIREILSWGEEAEVVAPAALRAEVKSKVDMMGKKYRS